MNSDIELRRLQLSRDHNNHCLRMPSVAEHSYFMCIYIMKYYDRIKPHFANAGQRTPYTNLLIEYALLHDVEEIFTGDVPSPMKNRISEVFDVVSQDWAMKQVSELMGGDKCGIEMPIVECINNLTILKFFDVYEYIAHLVQERRMGNTLIGNRWEISVNHINCMIDDLRKTANNKEEFVEDFGFVQNLCDSYYN
jgi:hypothetical protein